MISLTHHDSKLFSIFFQQNCLQIFQSYRTKWVLQVCFRFSRLIAHLIDSCLTFTIGPPYKDVLTRRLPRFWFDARRRSAVVFRARRVAFCGTQRRNAPRQERIDDERREERKGEVLLFVAHLYVDAIVWTATRRRW